MTTGRVKGDVVDGLNNDEWSGKADQLLQHQLKKVQEECRQLRDTYRRESSSSRLSRNSRSNSTQSLVVSSSRQLQFDSSSSPLTPPHPSFTTPHKSHHHYSLLDPKLNLTSSSTSLRSTLSADVAPPTITSSRGHHSSSQVKERKYRNGRGGRGGGAESYKTKKAVGEKNSRGYVSDASSKLGLEGLTNNFKSSSTTISIPTRLTSVRMSSYRGGDEDGVERGRVRQLEHEVSVLEQQLEEKTKSVQNHIEEVTCVRSELARERATLAREKQEAVENVTNELRKEKSSHEEQERDLLNQLERLTLDKKEGDRELDSLKVSLKGRESEILRLTETVSRLTEQLERERGNNSSSIRSLQSAADEERSKVVELELALHSCHQEVASHTTHLSQLDQAHRAELDTFRHKVIDLEERGREMIGEVEEKNRELTRLQRELSSVMSQLEEKTRCLTQLQTELTRLHGEKEKDKEGDRKRERELQRSLEHSEAVRRSLLEQVQKNGEELGRMTDRLSAMEQRERDIEQYQHNTSHLHQMVSNLQREKREMKTELQEYHQDKHRLIIELGNTQAQLKSTKSQLQQARERETEYSRATAELIRESGQVRAESARMKEEIERGKKQLEQIRGEVKKKAEMEVNSIKSLNQELTHRAQQVLEMEKLLRTQQSEHISQKNELEQRLSECRNEVNKKSEDMKKLKDQLMKCQERADSLQKQVDQLHTIQNDHSSDLEKQLSSKENELAALRRQLGSLQQSHSNLLTSSEQLSSTHRKTEVKVAEQLQQRQQELSRTRAQVSSLSIELTAEKKVSEELRTQLTLARAESARYQAQNRPPYIPLVTTSDKLISFQRPPANSSSTAAQKKSHVIDL